MSENKYLIGMEYMELLQKALIELGGEAPKKTVILKMKELLGGHTKESDRTFEVMVEYARQYLMEANVMVMVKRGVWTLAEDGEKVEINDDLRNKVIEIENTKEKKSRAAKNGRSQSTENILRWCQPIVEALKKLGGAAKPDEVRKQIVEDVKPDEEYLSQTRGKNNINLFQNEVDFARSYLAQAGIIDKEIRGVWTLTEMAKKLEFNQETIDMIYRSWPNSKKQTEDSGNVMADSDVKKVTYWVYSPANSADGWDGLYQKGIIDIGWELMNDLNNFEDKEEIRTKLQELYDQERSFRNVSNELWQFVKEMKPGDVVFVRDGAKTILGKGIVEGDYGIVKGDYAFDDNQKEYRHIR
ncbi:MAG: hypothetical protein IKY08_05350, partial [Firmicutes bacterium]|nr:hypothetical protein [Bacillota bacterium]